MVRDAVRRVIILAPMPLEMEAIVAAFGLQQAAADPGGPWTGRRGGSDVTCVHTGMGPAPTRTALAGLLSGPGPVDHVMIAGICGGLDPDLPVGTLVNPEFLIDHTSGARYRHTPPGDAPQAGYLVTTEGVSLDPVLSRRFFDEGCVAVDMESAAVGEVCSGRGIPWSVYRCIGDRHFDGLLDERVLALANPDGSGDPDAIGRLLAADPQLAANLAQLSRDAARAARLAAEAAARGCDALDGGA